MIRRAVLPNGEISDDASPELRRIRATIGRRVRLFRNRSSASCARVAATQAKTTSRCATTASSFPFARPIAGRCKASCTLRAPRARRYSSSRLKPSSSTTGSCSSPKTRPRKSRASSMRSPSGCARISGRCALRSRRLPNWIRFSRARVLPANSIARCRNLPASLNLNLKMKLYLKNPQLYYPYLNCPHWY